jgi:tetratricopeptide (TPR) repeat protein
VIAHTTRSRRTAFATLFAFLAAGLASGNDPKSGGYPFSAPPLELYDRLVESKLGDVPKLPADERNLLAKVWAKKVAEPAVAVPLERADLVELLLFASGVEDADKRAGYRKKVAELDPIAANRPTPPGDPRAAGEEVMKLAHGGVMKNGYETKQTLYTAVFDTGTYNCVSSTAVVYLAGTARGLDLRPMAVSGGSYTDGHAYLDLVVGKERILVEATNPDGFDWAEKVKRPGVIALGPQTDRSKAREVDAPGIPAMIYSNRGVGLDKGGDANRLAAARCYLSALALDPSDGTAANNLLALFTNWGPALTKEGRYEDAVRVYAFALKMAPHSGPLKNNHHVAWVGYVDHTLATKKDAEAVALVARAVKAVPGDPAFQSAAESFVRHALNARDKDGWDAGIAVLERGLKVVPEAERKALRGHRSGFFRGWSQALLAKGDVDGSMTVLARGYALDPADEQIHAGIGYHTQEALAVLGKKSVAAVAEHLAALGKQFPKVDDVRRVGEGHAARAVRKLADDGKYTDALEAIDTYRALLPTADARTEHGVTVYDLWARSRAKQGDWDGCLGKYVEGLKKYPQADRLTNNAVASVDEWAGGAMSKKDWDEAIRIYGVGLKSFPESGHLKHNKEYCEHMRKGK